MKRSNLKWISVAVVLAVVSGILAATPPVSGSPFLGEDLDPHVVVDAI